MTEHPQLVFEPIELGEGSWLGAGAVVLQGTIVGAGCTIGPNAVVKGEDPPGSVLVGNPARFSTGGRNR